MLTSTLDSKVLPIILWNNDGAFTNPNILFATFYPESTSSISAILGFTTTYPILSPGNDNDLL